ncbi:MAG TPA: hypothetical protein VHN80_10870 [Kineosporiaceae bacterium]|nr:hypothetical protein [Kineosporiaceae bacterium]
MITYTAEGRGVGDAARCVGTAQRNSVYGSGVVNAFAAVTVGR